MSILKVTLTVLMFVQTLTVFGGTEQHRSLFHTRSIVACNPATRECGIAVVSYPATSPVVPVGSPGVIVANQSFPSFATAEKIIRNVKKGSDAQSALDSAIAEDPGRRDRQFGVAELSNSSPSGVSVATFSGNRNPPETCGLTGATYAVQANTQSSSDVCRAMADAFEVAGGSLARRLLKALIAGSQVGGDARGEFGATVRVFSNQWLLAEVTPISVDANVDRSAQWKRDLEFNLNSWLSVITPGSAEDLVELSAERGRKIQTVLKKLGYYKGAIQDGWSSEADQALIDFGAMNLFFPRGTVEQNGRTFIEDPLAAYIITGEPRKVLLPSAN